MLSVLLLIGATLTDQSGCVDPDALARELLARAPQAVVDVEVSSIAAMRNVRLVITNFTPPIERELLVRDSECAELPHAIATIAAAAFEHRDVLDGPTLVVEEPASAAPRPPTRKKRADLPPPKDPLAIAPIATTGVSAAARDQLLVDVFLGGGAELAQGWFVGRLQGLLRQTLPVQLDATSATLTSLVLAPDVGVAFDALGNALIPRAGVELGGAAAVRLDGKRFTVVPRADLQLAFDFKAGPGQLGVGLRVPLLPVVLVEGAARAQEPAAWLGLHAGWAF